MTTTINPGRASSLRTLASPQANGYGRLEGPALDVLPPEMLVKVKFFRGCPLSAVTAPRHVLDSTDN